MRALQIISSTPAPLALADRPIPVPGPHQVLIKISCCGICHTELDEIHGRTPPPVLPVIPGHEVVGRITALGSAVTNLRLDQRVGVGWIAGSCGHCTACLNGDENLCPEFLATGRDTDGGYADYLCINADHTTPIPKPLTDDQAAPLLCAGAVGYRALRLASLGHHQRLGLTGFGASGHITIQLARRLFPDLIVYVFARDAGQRELALTLGANWAGDIGEDPPLPLHAIIDTTPAWRPMLESLRHLAPGGRLVINVIRKESLDQAALTELDYGDHLWLEKELKSVANVTRTDIRATLDLAAAMAADGSLQLTTQRYDFNQANAALEDLQLGQSRGAKVLCIDPALMR